MDCILPCFGKKKIEVEHFDIDHSQGDINNSIRKEVSGGSSRKHRDSPFKGSLRGAFRIHP